MIQSAERGSKRKRGETPADASPDELPYVVELWNAAGTKVVRAIARAHNLGLARAIFRAASAENPQRRLTLRRNGRILASSKDAERSRQ
jgi:hypothetical protein